MMCLVLGASNDKSCRKDVFSGWASKDKSCRKDVFRVKKPSFSLCNTINKELQRVSLSN